MKNITELINKHAVLYDDLTGGGVEPYLAKEINNAAGKMIGALKVQLEYHAARNETPEIEFLTMDNNDA